METSATKWAICAAHGPVMGISMDIIAARASGSDWAIIYNFDEIDLVRSRPLRRKVT